MGFRIAAIALLWAQGGAPSTDQATIDQQSRDWLLSMRVAYDDVSAEHAERLEQGFARLDSAQLRGMVAVYEQHYQVAAPFRKLEAIDPVEARRQWILAHRIVHENLSMQEAADFAKVLAGMSASQIEALAKVYEQKADIETRETPSAPLGTPTSHPPPPSSEEERPPSEEERQDGERSNQAEVNRQMADLQRQIALERAGRVRGRKEVAYASLGRSAAATARSANHQLAVQRAFAHRLYERGTLRGNWRQGRWSPW